MKRKTIDISSLQMKKIDSLPLRISEKSTIKQLFETPQDYMDDPRFRRPTVMNKILSQQINVIPGTTPILEQEQTLFLQMNYARYRLAQCYRKLLRSSRWDFQIVQQMLDWNQKQLQFRSQIVSANMGLVLAMAKRFKGADIEFTDLISEGSMALLRATEKFDCARGWKFSTYACRAILKSFSRAAKQNYRYRSRFPAQLEPTMIKDDFIEQKRDTNHQDWVDEVRYVVNRNLAELTRVEQSVVEMRFSLNKDAVKPLTLKQVGAVMGLTKERIRQIQNKALVKLRDKVEDRMVV